MKIKSGDNVIVITGKDKGKTGKVATAIPREDKVIVDGINIKKSHQKPRRQGQKGQIVEKAYPIHVSNVKKVEGEGEKPKKAKAVKKPKAEAK